MRMWMTDPAIMCRQHLLGEHVELHMFLGSLKKGIDFDGYVVNNLVEPAAFAERHDALVSEMRHRGYNHQSPLPEATISLTAYPLYVNQAKVNREKALTELLRRCPECRERFQKLVDIQE